MQFVLIAKTPTLSKSWSMLHYTLVNAKSTISFLAGDTSDLWVAAYSNKIIFLFQF